VEAAVSESKHTPGPWNGTQPAGGFANINDQHGDLIFAVAYPSLAMKDKARSGEECEANYRLAIAAPDLLAALELAADCLAGHHFETIRARLGEQCDICKKRSPSVFAVIQAAISKTRGEV
jgi:hypothetical protein